MGRCGESGSALTIGVRGLLQADGAGGRGATTKVECLNIAPVGGECGGWWRRSCDGRELFFAESQASTSIYFGGEPRVSLWAHGPTTSTTSIVPEIISSHTAFPIQTIIL